MASAQRGRPDGNLVKITLSNGLSVTCAIYHGNAASLGRCQECGHFPEEVYFLSCRHTLCMQCFHARTEYVCKADKTKTKIQRGVEHSYCVNLRLHKILLECPRCRNPQTYKQIKEHIEMEHPEFFGQEEQHPPPKEQVPQPHSPTFVGKDYAAGTRGRYGSTRAAYPSSFRRPREDEPKKGYGGSQVPQPRSPTFVGKDYAAGTRGRYASTRDAYPSSLRRPREDEPKKAEDEWHQDQAQLGDGGNVSSHHSQPCGRESGADIDSEMLTDDESSDEPLRKNHSESGIQGEDSEEIVTCPHCFSPMEVTEIEEHKQNCPQHSVRCHVCKKLTTVLSYDEHVQSHYEAEQRKNTGAQKARDDGLLSGKDAEKLCVKFQKGQMEEEPSGPMSREEIAKYIQSLKTKDKKCNESCQPQTQLLAAIDAPAQEAKKDREDTRGKKTRNEPVEIPATEPTREQGDDSREKRKNELVVTAVADSKQEDDDDELNKRKEITALKNRIKELEDRLEKLEGPLKRLIERLSQEKQRKG